MDGKARRGRPKCTRVVSGVPEVTYFKPRGIPLSDLEVVLLTYEELEAVSLMDYCDLEQEEAASRMNVSRRTFARELSSGRKKIIDALLNGKAIEIKGGNYVAVCRQMYSCRGCGHVWGQSEKRHVPKLCPKCSGEKINKKA